MPHVLVATDELVRAGELRDARPGWHVTIATDPSSVEIALGTGADMVVFDTTAAWVNDRLLQSAVLRDPSAVRVALVSEQAVSSAVHTATLVHQVVPVRSHSGVIADICERALRTRELLSSPELLNLVASSGEIPAPPRMWQQMTQVLEDPNAEVRDVARVIASDAAVAAQVLKLVNSAYFGVGRQVGRLEEAVSLLGLAAIRALVLEATASRAFPVQLPGFAREELNHHGQAVAAVGRVIAGKSHLSEVFQASLLLDIGLVLLAAHRPAETLQAIEASKKWERPLFEIERELLGYSHAEVGGCLLGLWGLPFTTVEAVAYHHECPPLEQPLSVRELVYIARDAVQAEGPRDPYGEVLPMISAEEVAAKQVVSVVVDNAHWAAAERHAL